MGDVWDKSVENSKEGKVLLGKKKKEILERERGERASEGVREWKWARENFSEWKFRFEWKQWAVLARVRQREWKIGQMRKDECLNIFPAPHFFLAPLLHPIFSHCSLMKMWDKLVNELFSCKKHWIQAFFPSLSLSPFYPEWIFHIHS